MTTSISTTPLPSHSATSEIAHKPLHDLSAREGEAALTNLLIHMKFMVLEEQESKGHATSSNHTFNSKSHGNAKESDDDAETQCSDPE